MPTKKKAAKQANDDSLNKQSPVARYKNARTAFEICKSEYEQENDHTKSIDSKVGLAIPLTSGLLVLIAETTDFKAIFSRPTNGIWPIFSTIVILILLFASLIAIVTSLGVLISIMFAKKYSVIEPYWFLNVDNLNEDEDMHYILSANFYAEACMINRETNQSRFKRFNTSLKLLAAGAVCFLVFFVLKFII